jgi:hypothetical protein
MTDLPRHDGETPLVGNVTAGVVRVGDTVRRPVGPWTDSVDAVLYHVRDVGFTGAPLPLGRDDRGRRVLEYVPGEVGPEAATYDIGDVASIGAFVRRLHDALSSFDPPRDGCWNVVIPGPGSTAPTVRTGWRPPTTSTRTSMHGPRPCAKLAGMTPAFAACRGQMMPRVRGR